MAKQRKPPPPPPLDYPLSHVVEQVLPWVLVIACAAALAGMTLTADDGGSGWGKFFRAGLVAALYLIVIFPLASAGVSRGAGTMGTVLPERTRWFVLAIFLVPAALAFFLFNIAGGFGGLLLGGLAGIVLASVLWWLLVRVKIVDAIISYVGGVIGFMIGLCIAALIMFGISRVFSSALRDSSLVRDLKGNPLGPQFAWSERKPVEPPPETKPQTPAKPATRNVNLVDQAVPPQLPAPPPLPTTVPKPPRSIVALAPTSAPALTPVRIETPQPPPPPPLIPANPWISEVKLHEEVGDLLDVIRPKKEGPWFVAVKRTPQGQDLYERWSTAPLTAQGKVTLQPDPAQRGRPVLSPSGEFMVRLASWPKLSAQVWSFKDDKLTRTIELEITNGTPELIGFSAPDSLMVHWSKPAVNPVRDPHMVANPVAATANGIEIFDVRTGQRRRQIVLPAHQMPPQSLCLSPDGKTIVAAARTQEDASLFFTDLTASRPGAPRKFKISAIDARWPVNPTGIDYSEDGRRIAIFFEQQGNGLAVCWNLADLRGKPLEHLFPAGILPADINNRMIYGQLATTSSEFLWIPSTNAWLLHGRSIISADEGKLITDLQIQNSRDRWITPDGTLWFITMNPIKGVNQLATAKINLAELPKAKS